MRAMLSMRDPVVNYDSTRAIKGIPFETSQSKIVTLIGANDAGKTATLCAISGLVKTKSGSVSFCDHDLLSTEPHKILGLGIAHVPEDHRIFSHMTVMENLQMGVYVRNGVSGASEDYDMVFGHLPRLKERRKQTAGTLSGGKQQMLAVGRALMGRPKMLLLNEPSIGLSPLLVGEIFKIISNVSEFNVTVLLVERDAKKALETADHACVLETGKIVMSGDILELVDNEEARKAYLDG